MRVTLHELRESIRHTGQDDSALTDEQLQARYAALGYEIVDENPILKAERERIGREDAAAGEPHGLDVEQVRAARRADMTLEHYAALLDVRNIDDFRALDSKHGRA